MPVRSRPDAFPFHGSNIPGRRPQEDKNWVTVKIIVDGIVLVQNTQTNTLTAATASGVILQAAGAIGIYGFKMGGAGLEPATPSVSSWCSNQTELAAHSAN